jgi:hypothetical protein
MIEAALEEPGGGVAGPSGAGRKPRDSAYHSGVKDSNPAN